MKLRVGVVGIGDAWDSRHRPALRALSDRFEVRAVTSEVSARSERAAREFNAVATDGFRTLVTRPDIDAVLALAPEWYGSLPIFAACDAGKAVFSAAELAADPAQARAIRDRVVSSGIAFMAEFPRRQAPATLRLKELIATKLGKPRLLFCHMRTLFDPPSGRLKHRAVANSSTRHLMELVDWCRYVVGSDPSSVLGVRHQSNVDASEDDYQMLSLDFSAPGEFATGPLAHVSCGRYMPLGWSEAIAFRPPAALQVCCENGIAFVDMPSQLVWFDKAGQHMESLESERPIGEQMFMTFHRAVTSLVRRSSDLEDAYRALAVVLAGQQSARENRRLPIEL